MCKKGYSGKFIYKRKKTCNFKLSGCTCLGFSLFMILAVSPVTNHDGNWIKNTKDGKNTRVVQIYVLPYRMNIYIFFSPICQTKVNFKRLFNNKRTRILSLYKSKIIFRWVPYCALTPTLW